MNLVIPDYIDKNFVNDWIGKQTEILCFDDLGHCFLVMTIDMNHKRTIYRFFNIFQQTNVSVDFQEDRHLDDEFLFGLFVKRSK